MEFADILEQTIVLLQHQGRISYGALKRRFGLDDAYLDDLKIELIEAQQLARDENGRILVWVGQSASAPPPVLESALSPATSMPQGALPYGDRHTPDAERRQLTVLFCDLVDSTVLASQLDPEDLREVIRAYQAACATVIEPLEGHIAQYLGDGLLVYFGYPQAHEDDAQRAVRTGLGMVAAMQALNTKLVQRHGVRIAVRIGIHTGVVVVGEMGGGSRQEQLALGDTPNMAARLQGLAAPDTVVLSAATFRLVQGYFTYQDLGVHVLKGIAAPIPVYCVLGESGVQSRLEATVPSRLTPLVGREEEVALLQQRWEQAKAGQGQVVLLSGEAGIGKSRLVQVLKDHIVHEPHARIEWRGSSYHQQSALYPVIAYLHRLLQWREDETPQEKLRTLETTLTLAKAHGLLYWEWHGTCVQGWALAMQGQREEGLAQMHQGLEALVATGSMIGQGGYLVWLAEVAGHAGRVEEGLHLLAEALVALEASQRGDMLTEMYWLQGELLLRQATPDAPQAEVCFQQALAIARRQQAKSWELRAAMSLCRLWQRQGRHAEAYELLAPIYSWFTEGFDTADLQEARALLAALGNSPRENYC
jgi:class 3 adenylate cyclase/energy-coupling factor transporter ATP-binding protein EcfA2